MTRDGITELIEELETLTRQAINDLENMDEEDFEQFTITRLHIVESMKRYIDVLNDGNKKHIEEILKLDPIILERMQALKDEAANWIERRESIRIQQNAYLHSYTHDSYFIDHKK
ncbi:hypothetical protein ACK8P5_23400 [Paenibacillus sp. EC2-1]|uniref:hypothetical protein n=1 Tax=Paenibacillus sp. EC2-1 TaxID=3388665 RepID=UPI003BEEBFD1